MGDVLVDQAKGLRTKCTRCSGRKFRVTLQSDTYIVDLEHEWSEATLDVGFREIVEMACTACGRKVRIQ